MMKVDAKIETLKYRPKKHVKEVLKQESIIEELNRLQDEYVFVPTDKASNNISIVCKEFYIKTMLKELKVFDCETDSNTYENITLAPDKTVEEHGENCKSGKLISMICNNACHTCTGYPKCTRIQANNVSLLHQPDAPQSNYRPR